MINTLVFDGGGTYGIAYIGVIKALDKLNMLKDIHTYKGCSVGSILALCLALGYTPEEIQDLLFKVDFNKVFAFSKIGIIKNGHYADEKYLVKCLKTIIQLKYDEHITFQELYDKTKKTLVFNTACLCDNKPVYFSHESHPETSVLLALTMSISIPYVFPFVEYKDKIYADGGICQLPVHLYDDNHLIFIFECIGVSLDKKDKFYHVKQIIQTIGRFHYDGKNIIKIPIERLHSLTVPTIEQKHKMIKDGFLKIWNHFTTNREHPCNQIES